MEGQSLTQRCGIVLRELAHRDGMNVHQFSRRLSLSSTSVYRYLSGSHPMPLKALQECCTALGTTADRVVAAADTIRYDPKTGHVLFDMPEPVAS